MAWFPPIETTMHHGYIETTMHHGKLHRVYRPFRQWEYFLFKINSVEEELANDKKLLQHIKQHGQPRIPLPSNYLDGDQLRDYFNDDSFINAERFNDQETTA